MATITTTATAGLAAALALTATIGTAHAAPTMELTNLPMSGELVDILASEHNMSEEEIQEFVNTIARITVYNDHTNSDDGDRNNPAVQKNYWAAPYLTPSIERSVVGAEQFADFAIEVLDSSDHLMNSFSFLAQEFIRLTRRLDEAREKLDSIDATLQNPDLPEAARDSLEQLRPRVEEEIAAIEASIAELNSDGAEGAGQLGDELKRSIADSILLQMSRIGVLPTAEELTLLESDDSSDWLSALRGVRQRAGVGQFGLRQVIVEGGFTAKQTEVLSTYLQLRPDVTVRGLAVDKLFVGSVAQTLVDDTGDEITRPSVVQIRGVNAGSNGVCGNTRSCNIVIEYTDVGARSVRFQGGLTDITPALVPVTFEADVEVALPDFVGSVECHFRTGWQAQGRADVKDGAIIYDGDLTNKIKFDSIDDEFGGCEFDIQEGSQDSAFFHILQDMDRFYRDLHTQRQQAAKAEKDAYRQSIEEELQRQQQNSQNRSSGGWFDDVLGLVTRGSFLRGVGAFFIGTARSFYWHTTQLDTHSIDEINVRQSYNVRNLTEKRRYAFDGYPLVCWTPSSGGGFGKVMKACPDEEHDNADTEVDVGDDTCSEFDIFGNCLD